MVRVHGGGGGKTVGMYSYMMLVSFKLHTVHLSLHIHGGQETLTPINRKPETNMMCQCGSKTMTLCVLGNVFYTH